MKLLSIARHIPRIPYGNLPALASGSRGKTGFLQSSKRSASTRSCPDTANTVIIGGGVVGTSIAYHLAKAGVKRVVLLERKELTAGSTWHAAGLTTYYHPGINLKKIHYDSLELYKKLEDETGQAIGLHTCGSIRLASTPERVDEIHYQMTRGRWHPNPQQLVTPDEIEKLHPLLNMEKILLGIYNPGDGHVDPYSLTQSLAAGARMYGAQIFQAKEVTGTTQRNDGRWQVETSDGMIIADRVVNAAGFHAREVGKLAGIDLPLVPIEHTYVVTSSIPEVQALKKEVPVIRDLEGSYYLRMERDGLLFGIYEAQDKMVVVEDWYDNGPPKGFGMELYNTDLERLSSNIEMAMDMVPVLKTAEITRSVNGPITYSPDVLSLLGPYQGLDNYWTAVGFGYGIIHGGGAGKYICEWMLNGEPPYDLIELDPNRFGHWADRAYVISKARETYGMNNAATYPKEDRPAGRPTKRQSSLYNILIQNGAEMGFHSGWEQPHWFCKDGDVPGYKPSFRQTNWFKPVLRECEMVMTKAGVIDLSPFGKIEVKGPDAHAFIDFITANNVPKAGRTCLSHMLTPAGKIYAELTVTCNGPDHFFCVTGSGSEFHDLRWMEIQAKSHNYNVEIINRTESLGCIGIAGPLSRDILSKVTSSSLTAKDFPFLTIKDIDIGGICVKAIRISYTGELGWELYTETENLPNVYNILMEVGSPLGCGDFGAYAMNTLRLEKGFRAWGLEMNVDKTPQEAGLMQFVNLDKECDFIGKVAMKTFMKSKSKSALVMMSVDTSDCPDVDPEGNESVWMNDQVVGNTTSGCFSYALNQPLVYSYVPQELSTPGTQFHVELLGNKCKASVLKSPPVQIEAFRK